mmetsp:Transcript_18606/g.46617  ORF Transcript_18606/g.46617 Transcript_18606/m.46617 type:complete len:287 (+) Transcript_18606:619-1479(+)
MINSCADFKRSEPNAEMIESRVPPPPPPPTGALKTGTLNTPTRLPSAASTRRVSTSPCFITLRVSEKLAREPSARLTPTRTGSRRLPKSIPATSSAEALLRSAVWSIDSKTSPTLKPAAAAAPSLATLTISTAPCGKLRTVTPMPPVSAGCSYLESRDSYAPGVRYRVYLSPSRLIISLAAARASRMSLYLRFRNSAFTPFQSSPPNCGSTYPRWTTAHASTSRACSSVSDAAAAGAVPTWRDAVCGAWLTARVTRYITCRRERASPGRGDAHPNVRGRGWGSRWE